MDSSGEYLELVGKQEGLTQEDKMILRSLIRSPQLMRAFNEALRSVDEEGLKFREIDYTVSSGVAVAIRLQGRGDGAIFIIESLYALAWEEEEKDEEQIDHGEE